MKRYHILDLYSDSRKVVMATSYVSPLSEVFSISDELREINYKGEVIFELVLSNGFSSNRFLRTSFNGEELDIAGIEVLTQIKQNILNEIYTFLSENPQYIKASSLPEPQKYALLNNVLLQ